MLMDNAHKVKISSNLFFSPLTMSLTSQRILRFSLALIYIWFGLLKPLGVSPAEGLVVSSVTWFDPSWFVPVLGIGEVVIGLCFLWNKTIKLGIVLILLHMFGVFFSTFIHPELVFTAPFAYTLEGQYVVKNVLILAAAYILWKEPVGPKAEKKTVIKV